MFFISRINRTAKKFAVKKSLGRVIILHIVHVMRRSFDKKLAKNVMGCVLFFSPKKIPKKKFVKAECVLYFKLRLFYCFHRRIYKISKCGDRSKNCVNLWEWGVLLSVWGFYFCIKFCSMLSILFTLFVVLIFALKEGGGIQNSPILLK